MSSALRLLCCRARAPDMGTALSHPHGEACAGADVVVAAPTMADVIRERKKKVGGSGLGTLRRRIAAAARRPREARGDRGCEHARLIRSVVSSWRLVDVFLLREELEAGAALRDLTTQAELAREPAAALHRDLGAALAQRWGCDVELVGAGWALPAHRALLAARCAYFRELLARHPAALRVPLEGAGQALSRADAHAVLHALYAPHAHSPKWERGAEPEADLDIINVDNGNACACAGGATSRLAALLGFSLDSLHADMRYLLDSGEWADTRLQFGSAGAQFGFRSHELPCHRLVLAARSRYFRSVMSRRSGAVCVDEKVLPRRFARALLHVAYTDQLDLSLIGRGSSPSSTTGTNTSTSSWGSGRGAGRAGGAALEDVFQLYEIARFLEMPILVQGCEDAVSDALCPDTVCSVAAWAYAPQGSAWVRRQAARLLRDELPAALASPHAGALPRAALLDALASPFLQAGESGAARALLRWADRDPPRRAALPALLALLRLDHLPPEHDVLALLARRGLTPPSAGGGGAAAWVAAAPGRGPRALQAHLDEVRALLAGQAAPAELSRARVARAHMPDALYMLGGGAAATGGASAREAAACVSPRVLAALRARRRELTRAPGAQRALALPATDAAAVHRQLALRAVRERSLPDECAELLLQDAPDLDQRLELDREWSGSSGSEAARESPRRDLWREEPCRRAGAAGAGGAGCAGCSLCARSREGSRTSTCRRDRDAHRSPAPECPAGGAGGGPARLSARVPDVAMAPNANTHLLTHRDYFRLAPPWELSGAGVGVGVGVGLGAGVGVGAGAGVLQLDLGDGATHTPRPGSRALRAQPPQHRVSGRRDDELRAAIHLSVIRAVSGAGAAAAGAGGAGARTPSPRRCSLYRPRSRDHRGGGPPSPGGYA